MGLKTMIDFLGKVKNNGLSDDAVSPVIGVILMVAITVILAAVIAVFVLGMADDVHSTKTVGVTAKLQDDDVIITYMGGPDSDSLLSLNVSVDRQDPELFSEGGAPYVGEKDNFSIVEGETVHTVVVVGEFSDGNEQVLLDTVL